jgi:xanthine dehydrogenase YagS FAD-binding subunit
MAVAMAMLNARVHTTGPDFDRVVPIGEFFVLPGTRPDRDNSLRSGELITGIELPPSRFSDASWYLKVRDRHSYAFALVSVAVGLQIDDGVIAAAGVALGGVAAAPWRCEAAERALIGKQADTVSFRSAARLATTGAVPLSQNGFKIDLVRHSVVRALSEATKRRPASAD